MKYVIQEPSRIVDRIFPMQNYKKSLPLHVSMASMSLM